MKASICLFIIVMFFIPATAIERISIEKEILTNEENHIQTANNDDYIDQRQEYGTEYKKLYGNFWFAQSFQPNADLLTGVEIKVGKYIKKYVGNSNEQSNFFNKIFSGSRIFRNNMLFSTIINVILQRFGYTLSRDSDLGPLTVSVYSFSYTKPGSVLRSKTFSPDEINKEAGWVKFDFGDNPIKYAFDDKYFIVCHAEGGDEEHYYKWMHGGNLYSRGYGSSSEDGNNWDVLYDVDFCFRNYGRDYDENKDGVKKKFAILTYDPDSVGVNKDISNMKKCLETFGWNDGYSTIWTYNYDREKSKMKETLKKLDEKENKDDIILFMYTGHYANLWWIKNWLDRCSAMQVVIIDCCYAGSYYGSSFGRGREVLMASEADEESWSYSSKGHLFIYHLVNGLNGLGNNNGDRMVTAEEAFNYAKDQSYYGHNQHPVMYDGYPGDIPITTW